jgi:hypothetical protein
MLSRTLLSRNYDTPAKALGLGSKRSRNGSATRELNLEQGSLGDRRPEGTDLGVSRDHRNQVGSDWASFIFCWFQNGAVNVNPNAGRRVFHAFCKFQRSKALVCVLHDSVLQ